MVKSKNQKVNHRKKKPTKNKKTIARLNKGSRGVMHWRHRNHKNNKSPWSFKFPETKKAIKKMFGYESEKRVSDSEKEMLQQAINDKLIDKVADEDETVEVKHPKVDLTIKPKDDGLYYKDVAEVWKTAN